jgi:hypothetical protein
MWSTKIHSTAQTAPADIGLVHNGTGCFDRSIFKISFHDEHNSRGDWMNKLQEKPDLTLAYPLKIAT